MGKRESFVVARACHLLLWYDRIHSMAYYWRWWGELENTSHNQIELKKWSVEYIYPRPGHHFERNVNHSYIKVTHLSNFLLILLNSLRSLLAIGRDQSFEVNSPFITHLLESTALSSNNFSLSGVNWSTLNDTLQLAEYGLFVFPFPHVWLNYIVLHSHHKSKYYSNHQIVWTKHSA